MKVHVLRMFGASHALVVYAVLVSRFQELKHIEGYVNVVTDPFCGSECWCICEG